MPSLTRKFIRGRPYYYARWCQRVDGRPKIVRTLYLGSLDNIVQAVETAQRPLPLKEAELASFADVAALYDQAAQLRLMDLIDAQIPKRHQGLSVGAYLVLASINRAAHPTSKAKLARWYRQTILPRLMPASADQLSSQAFWNHMDQVTQADIEAEDRVIATGGIHYMDYYYHSAFLCYGLVHPQHQGVGIGTALLLTRLALLNDQRHWYIVTLFPVKGSIGFYRRFGFRQWISSMESEARQRGASLLILSSEIRRIRKILVENGVTFPHQDTCMVPTVRFPLFQAATDG
jgi:GNAT superfamily N-acetyltransferase